MMAAIVRECGGNRGFISQHGHVRLLRRNLHKPLRAVINKPMMNHLPRAEAAGMTGSSTKPSIFISYAHEDEPETATGDSVKWLSFVTLYLLPAVTQGMADVWVDNLMRGG